DLAGEPGVQPGQRGQGRAVAAQDGALPEAHGFAGRAQRPLDFEQRGEARGGPVAPRRGRGTQQQHPQLPVVRAGAVARAVVRRGGGGGGGGGGPGGGRGWRRGGGGGAGGGRCRRPVAAPGSWGSPSHSRSGSPAAAGGTKSSRRSSPLAGCWRRAGGTGSSS